MRGKRDKIHRIVEEWSGLDMNDPEWKEIIPKGCDHRRSVAEVVIALRACFRSSSDQMNSLCMSAPADEVVHVAIEALRARRSTMSAKLAA